nr:MAG: hypothetical protein M1812_001781 [Candelaria pacifica]
MKSWFSILIAAAAIRGGANAADPVNPSQHATDCCGTLTKALPNLTYSNGPEYQRSIDSYFSLQDRLTPTCIVIPSTSTEVAQIVTLLGNNSCPFAVRSGGHGLVVGAANIDTGVTVDLSRLSRVSLSADKTYASVGPGARWADVYAVLDAQGYAVPGGRAGSVGVGGLITGGGNSFFAARYGFVCDNVILGNGTLVTADNTTRPDLFQALKGGSNNLGIVTRFDIFAVQQGDIWGGVVTYLPTTARQQISAFADFTDTIVDDPYASMINIWLFVPSSGAFFIRNSYEYTRTVENVKAGPPPFKTFLSIQPELNNTMRNSNLSDLTTELESPPGLRNIYSTLTFKNDAQVLGGVVNILQAAINVTNRDQPFYLAGWEFQPLPRLFTDHSIERGGNVLGLDETQDNQVLFQLLIAYNGTDTNGAANDAAMQALSDGIIAKLTEFLEGAKALNKFVYLNYADTKQNPIAGYGEANIRKLVAASQKYDPGQVFQRLVPGGFKLPIPSPKTPETT